MARDESRHAGFINKALNKLGVAVDLGVLKREKEYTYFKPKYIYYVRIVRENRLRALHHDLSSPRTTPREAIPSDLQMVFGVV